MIAGIDLFLVEKLDSCYRDSKLNDYYYGIDGLGSAGERAGQCFRAFRDAVQAQRDFSYHTQRTLGANQEMGKIQTCGCLSRSSSGPDNAAVGQHCFQRQHILFHRSVSHRIGA